ncbi:hypothetical protein C8Q77DRAFT_1162376 [Trametes polyzona]|nr:hypothetical protein C8Q77DRAFT_1162376 [Trametes polyzona]
MTESARYTPSPSSSPSLAPVDSSPPSSPSPFSLRTPPASPGAQDPFAGSTKSSKRPRIYERNDARRLASSIQRFVPDRDQLGDAGGVLTRAVEADDVTPTRVVDPFSASAKRTWRPPTYEKKKGRVLSTDSATSASSSASYAYVPRGGASPTPASRTITMTLDDEDDFILTDDELERPQPNTRKETQAEVEHRLWDEAITTAIDKLNGVIDLAGGLVKGPITHIPPTIADLEGFVVLSPTQLTSSAPSSPKHPPKDLPSPEVESESTASSSRTFARATTLPASAFNEHFFLRSKDGERLRGTPAARAASLQAVPQPTSTLQRREINMYLANNTISRLPAELFRLHSLTILSLRSNALTSIPPQISQLTLLRSLNVAQNKLRWLPAELLNMRISELVISGNPWIPPPASEAEFAQPSRRLTDDVSTRRRRKPVSETTVHFTVSPLTEICFRALLAPYSPNPPTPYTPNVPVDAPPITDPPSSPRPPKQNSPPASSTDHATDTPVSPPSRALTVLEAMYALPITEDVGLGPSVLATLRSCVPAAVAKPPTADHLAGPSKVRRDDGQRDVHSSLPHSSDRATTSLVSPDAADEDEPGLSICLSPRHHGELRVPVFVRPAEERFTWEEVVAGVRVGGEGFGGSGVPVRWRGCSRGCLAFLDPEPEDAPPPTAPGSADTGTGASAEDVDLALVPGLGAGGEVLDADVEMAEGGSEVDMQEVRFEGGLADPEDFEEGF